MAYTINYIGTNLHSRYKNDMLIHSCVKIEEHDMIYSEVILRAFMNHNIPVTKKNLELIIEELFSLNHVDDIVEGIIPSMLSKFETFKPEVGVLIPSSVDYHEGIKIVAKILGISEVAPFYDSFNPLACCPNPLCNKMSQIILPDLNYYCQDCHIIYEWTVPDVIAGK